MALPQVGQAQLLSRPLGEAIERHRPSAVALLGCAEGNGLERIPASSVERVVCIDINQQYLERYGQLVHRLELVAGNLETDSFTFGPVDLVFAGLIFEYVDARALLRQTRYMLRPEGRLVSVVQLPSRFSDVTPSPYVSLDRLAPALRVVPVQELKSLALEAGFKWETESVVTASGGKSFQVNTFQATTEPSPA